jgi:glycosyltransferase involved in cell wall biosynthesis
MILEILKNPEPGERMGKKARERAESLFSWDRNAEIMWNLI